MTKLIKLSDIHYIVVDDSEIKKGDFVLLNGEVRKVIGFNKDVLKKYRGRYGRTSSTCYSIECGHFSCFPESLIGNKVIYSTDPISYEGLNSKHSMKIKRLYVSDIEQLIYGYNLEGLAEQKADALNYQFDDYCGSCYNDYVEGYEEGFKKHQELVKAKSMNSGNQNHLQWIYDRLHFVYGENENYDFMIKFKNIIEFLTPSKTEWLVQVKDNKIHLI